MVTNLSKCAVVCVLVLAGASAHAQSFSSQSGRSFNGASQGDDHEQSFNGIRNRGGENERGGNGRGNGNGWGNGNGNGNGWGNRIGSGGGHVSPIPEPSTYALMLAGLGVVGFMARRRRAG